MVRCLTCNVLHVRQFCKFSLLFSIIWYCRIQSPAVFKQRDVRWCGFRWSIPLWIGYVWNSCIDRLFRLLHDHIAYETDTDKIIAEFPIVYMIWRLHSIVCNVQTTRCTMMWFSMIDYDVNWLFLKCAYWFLDTHIACEIAIWKITTGNWHDAWNDLSCRTVVKR